MCLAKKILVLDEKIDEILVRYSDRRNACKYLHIVIFSWLDLAA